MAPPTDAASDEGRRLGKHEAVFREVNERIEEISSDFDVVAAIPLLCECAEVDCTERIELTRAEYERLRAEATHFAVVPGHEIPSIERVVEVNDRYVVVEKFGESAVAAVKLDPRRPRP